MLCYCTGEVGIETNCSYNKNDTILPMIPFFVIMQHGSWDNEVTPRRQSLQRDEPPGNQKYPIWSVNETVHSHTMANCPIITTGPQWFTKLPLKKIITSNSYSYNPWYKKMWHCVKQNMIFVFTITISENMKVSQYQFIQYKIHYSSLTPNPSNRVKF